jgi:hypothetical protein
MLWISFVWSHMVSVTPELPQKYFLSGFYHPHVTYSPYSKTLLSNFLLYYTCPPPFWHLGNSTELRVAVLTVKIPTLFN